MVLSGSPPSTVTQHEPVVCVRHQEELESFETKLGAYRPAVSAGDSFCLVSGSQQRAALRSAGSGNPRQSRHAALRDGRNSTASTLKRVTVVSALTRHRKVAVNEKRWFAGHSSFLRVSFLRVSFLRVWLPTCELQPERVYCSLWITCRDPTAAARVGLLCSGPALILLLQQRVTA